MQTRIFICYCRKDEQFRRDLETHLSTLKRSGHVETWSDRLIEAGQEWEGEIDANLTDADITLLLVSSDFLASSYCNDVELRHAVQLHQEGRMRVVPVIIRPCDWTEASFGKFQALPSTATPISKWNDADSAWLDVVKGLKPLLKTARPGAPALTATVTNPLSRLTPTFTNWLVDTEIELAHRNISTVTLTDVFVYPDLRVIERGLKKIATTVDSRSLVEGDGLKLIFGDEQCGKTSLAKQLFLELVRRGRMPLLISGENVTNSDLVGLLRRAYSEQYRDGNFEQWHGSSHRAVLVDDYSSNKLNKKTQNKLLQEASHAYSLVLVFASDSFRYVVPEIEAFEKFEQFEILLFGVLKRTELIEKWVSIGVREQIDEQDLYKNLDGVKLHLDTFVKKNIVPSKPVYLLVILQTLEAFTPQRVELTSYGHCYQYLIYKALAKAKIKTALVDSYLNWLTELAHAIFEGDGSRISRNELDAFTARYEGTFLRVENIVEDFLRSGILHERDDGIGFKHRYVYYFYAAKWLAEHLSQNDESRNKIRELLQYLHREDSANIIIFLTHHTKDPWVLDEVQLCVMELFADCREATLDVKDLEFMGQFLDKIPRLVIEQREIEAERRKRDVQQEEAEVIERTMEVDAAALEPSDMLAKINRGFKGIELIGQILRNRHGSLDKMRLKQMASDAFGVGLRFLQCFLDISEAAKEEVIRMIEYMLRENPRVGNEKVEKEARAMFLMLTYWAIFGVLRKIASATGSNEAIEVYGDVEKDTPTPAVKLINLAISLQFQKHLDQERLKELAHEFNANITCDRLLKEIVIQHIYLHHIGYKEKQQIAEVLKLPLMTQNSIELRRKFEM